MSGARLRPIVYVHGAPTWAQSGSRSAPTTARSGRAPRIWPTSPRRCRGDSVAPSASRASATGRCGTSRTSASSSCPVRRGTAGLAGLVSQPRQRDVPRRAWRSCGQRRHRGGLAPFGGNVNDPSGGPVPDQERTRPMEFMREMLCMSRGSKPAPTCNERSDFDVWAHHPYTYGGPTHQAFHPDDVSLGDLPEMRRLPAGRGEGRAHPLATAGRVLGDGIQLRLAARRPQGIAARALCALDGRGALPDVAERRRPRHLVPARDQPFPDEMFQSGLYLRGAGGVSTDRPKLALQAFRFPFVAFRQKDGSISYWGRTPTSTKTAIVVEQRRGVVWVRVAASGRPRRGLPGKGREGAGTVRFAHVSRTAVTSRSASP